MAVILANVNISIQQFQAVATGKYNAGEVRLATKNAFIKALSQNGVGADEIANRIGNEIMIDARDLM